jgi:hypothetical protein
MRGPAPRFTWPTLVFIVMPLKLGFPQCDEIGRFLSAFIFTLNFPWTAKTLIRLT